jgi:hypothetical protein
MSEHGPQAIHSSTDLLGSSPSRSPTPYGDENEAGRWRVTPRETAPKKFRVVNQTRLM